MKLVKEECVRGDVLAEIKKTESDFDEGAYTKKMQWGLFLS